MSEYGFYNHLKIWGLDEAYPYSSNKWPLLKKLDSYQNLQKKIGNLSEDNGSDKFSLLFPHNLSPFISLIKETVSIGIKDAILKRKTKIQIHL